MVVGAGTLLVDSIPTIACGVGTTGRDTYNYGQKGRRSSTNDPSMEGTRMYASHGFRQVSKQSRIGLVGI